MASTEQAYWATVTQVSGVAGQSTSIKAAAMRSGGVPIVAGQFKGVATFPTGPSTSVTLTDDSTTIFVAALTPTGENFDWVTKITGVSTLSQVAAVNTVAVSADDTIYVGGQFYGAAYFRCGVVGVVSAVECGNTYSTCPGLHSHLRHARGQSAGGDGPCDRYGSGDDGEPLRRSQHR